MNQQKSYKESHSLEERRRRVQEQREKYPEMIPIIVEKGKKCKLADLQRVKYLVNSGFRMTDFKLTIKKKIGLDEKLSTLFFYCDRTLISEEQTLQNIYDRHKDPEDGFLYITYHDSEAFGTD